jgi:hypothetical protein
MQQNSEQVTVTRFGQRCRFVWRPPSFDFEPVVTYRQNGVQSAGSVFLASEGDLEMADILPPDTIPNKRLPCPYGLAVVLTLAGGTFGTGVALPVIIRTRIITDESLSFTRRGGVDTNVQYSVNSNVPIHNSALRDKHHNKLSQVHRARTRLSVKNHEAPFANLGKAVAEGAGSAIADKVMSSIASAF